MKPDQERSAASIRAVEFGTALIIFVFGAVVVFDSWRLGARWAEDGPQAGYFPFYIGLLILVASGSVLLRALKDRAAGEKSFVARSQLRMILSLVVPAAIYIALIHWLGIYVASAIFILFFMIWLGGYRAPKAVAVSVAVMVVFFLVFDTWFKVPLPKGPLELWLGLA